MNTTDIDQDAIELAAMDSVEATIDAYLAAHPAPRHVAPAARWLFLAGPAAGNISPRRALAIARELQYAENGDPQVYPYDNSSADIIRTRPGSADATAVRMARRNFSSGHTTNCCGALYRGLCHA